MKSAGADTWFSVDLGDAVLATTVCVDIEETFRAVFVTAGQPVDMAVFKRHDDDRGLHCAVTAYFSPAAAAVAAAFDATPCARPSRRGLELLAGDPDSWRALFESK